MSTHSIEPGQRLEMQAGNQTGLVQVLSQAVVPAGYWICREERSGQQRIIARTALFPIAGDPSAVNATETRSTIIPTAA